MKSMMMHGQNFLFNQPLAIDRNYLLSVLQSVMLGYQKNSFESASRIQQRTINAIQAQMDSAKESGASKYPIVFNIIGPIIKYTDWNYLGTQSMMRILSYLDASDSISGIVFNIDSGGGMVSGTAEFADFIKNMKKPTISFTNDTQCSAAQWIASACTYKMAGPHARDIGSIGTMLSYQDFSAMFEKWGAKIHEVYAPESSEKNSEFREMLLGNQKPYEERLSTITQDFIATIKSNIPGLEDDGHVFKGTTYSAADALKIGLINEIGTLNEALSKF